MSQESLQNHLSAEDEQVIDVLRKKLTFLKTALSEEKAARVIDGPIDDEDLREDLEEGDEQSATVEVLKRDIEITERKLAWVEKNGGKCACPDCSNMVEAKRRQVGGVTCDEHKEDEEGILERRAATGDL